MYIFLALVAIWSVFDIIRGYRKAGDKKQYLRKTLISTTMVILILFLFGPFFIISPLKLGYSTLAEANITIYYPSSHTARAKEILAMAKQAAEKNDAFYHIQTHTKILVASSNLDMLRFGVYPRANGAGLIWGIIIRESKASWNILAHEMSHKNLSKLSPFASSIFSFPRWFDEGLASYLGDMNYYKTIPDLKEDLQQDLYYHDITRWKGIPGMFTWLKFTFIKPNPKLIYGQTFLMVKYLADTYGQDNIYQLVQLGSRGSSFQGSFINIFTLSPEAFHQQFIDFLQEN